MTLHVIVTSQVLPFLKKHGARGLDGYTGYQSAIIMILQSTRRYSSTGAARINPGHGTKIARGLDGYKK